MFPQHKYSWKIKLQMLGFTYAFFNENQVKLLKRFAEYYLSPIGTSLVWREFRIHNCQGCLQRISIGLFIVLSIWDWFGIVVGIAILSFLWLATELIVYNGGGYQTECNVPSLLFHNSVVYSKKLVLVTSTAGTIQVAVFLHLITRLNFTDTS